MKRRVLATLTAAVVGVFWFGFFVGSPEPAGAATTLSLTVDGGNATTVTFGNETSLVFSVSIDAGVSGTVTVTSGSTPVCTATLTPASTTATGQCSPSSDTLLAPAATNYSVSAGYQPPGQSPLTSSSVSVTIDQVQTTTTLAVAPPSPVTYGQESSLTFTAGVTPDIAGTPPTGTIDVAAGPTAVCSITLPATTCSPAGDPLVAASSAYAVTATYVGDTDYAASVSSVQDMTVDQASTTLNLSVSTTTVVEGDESTLQVEATVTPQFSGTPTGTIAVTANSSPLCTITLPATTCPALDSDVLTAASSPYELGATYSGDTNFTSSISNTEQLTVSTGNSETALSIAPSSTAVYGNEQTVMFGGTVTPSGTSGSPTGTMTITASDGTTGPVTLCSFDVTMATSCTTSDTALTAGSYAVVASYSGDGTFTPSSSDPQDFTVGQATATTSLTPPSATVAYGGQVTFASSVTPEFSGTPTGTVTIASGSTTLCTFDAATESGCTANVTALDVSAVPYSVVATYGGDQNFSSSPSPATNLTVTQASTGTSLLLSSSTVTYGDEQTVTFTATVTPEFSGTPTGSITVATTTGPTTLCTITLPATTCSLDTTALDASTSPNPVVASYGGDTNFTGSASSPAQDLTVTQATSTTRLGISSSGVTYGNESSLDFTAIVTPQFAGTPTGSVEVMAGATQLCSITLPATQCSTVGDPLAASDSPYGITAAYQGDTDFTGSTSSPAQMLTVTQATTTISLSVSPASVVYGNESSVEFTATLNQPFSGTPTGTISVEAGATTLCTITLPAAPLSCSTGDDVLAPSVTSYQVTAHYGGDTNFTSSTSSPAQDLTIAVASSTTTLSPSPSSVDYGDEERITFSATVAPGAADGPPSGTVTVATGATVLCRFVLPANSCTTTPTALGASATPYSVVATYGGDTTYAGSTSSPVSLVTIAQARPSAPSITNLPSGATEAGSFSADVVTNGDGAVSVTSDTPGNCTVGSDGLTVRFLLEGQCTLTSHVSSGANYVGANGSPQTFAIGPGPRGYWLVGSDGGIFSFGAAVFHGSMGGTPLQRPVVGITPTSSKNGYWLVASDGGIFAFGDANFFGSIPGLGLHPAGSGLPDSLDAPIVGMVPSHDGGGYFMVASDGGVFAFGDAKFAGSCPGIPGGCSGQAVAVMPDASGNGYWLVTSTGSVYAFGDARFFGAPAPQSTPVVAAVATPDGGGYWLLYSNGVVLGFGDAGTYGGPVGYVNAFDPATSIFPTTDGLGYWVASAKGDVFTYGNAPFLGSMSSTPLNGPIIAAFGF